MRAFPAWVPFLILTGASVFAAVRAPDDERASWENSVVLIEVTQKHFDYAQPWFTQNNRVQKPGVVVSRREILTTAQFLNGPLVVRLQKGGRGAWRNGRVTWVDYHANLALVTVDDEGFWKGLRPAELADPIPTQGGLHILRWRNGNLEDLNAEVQKISLGANPLGHVKHLMLEMTSNMDGGGWSEIVTDDRRVVGITYGQTQNHFYAIPSTFIRPILQARRAGRYTGVGCFDFGWQTGENPSNLEFVGLEKPPRGVIVTKVPERAGKDHPLKPRDVILEVDGHAVDIQGYYKDPHYGYLSFEDLASRGRMAGGTRTMKVWRDGAVREVQYVLPGADAAAKIVDERESDDDPEYLIAGGLVFQPLLRSFYRGWQTAWTFNLPSRLFYSSMEEPTKERTGVVLLSSVLPDAINLGYQNYRCLAVERINGNRISTVADVDAALRHPKEGFHVIEFAKGRDLQRMVLDAAETEAATKRVLERYGIQKDRVFRSEKKSAPAPTM